MGPYCVLASFSGPGLRVLLLSYKAAAVEADGESLGARALSLARVKGLSGSAPMATAMTSFAVT